MLLLALSYLYIFLTCSFIGKYVSDKLHLSFSNSMLHVGIGIISITTAARIWGLFFGIGMVFQAVILLSTALAYLASRSKQSHISLVSLFKKNHLLVTCTALFVLFFSSQQSISYDEGLYHASFIEWLNEYGFVKGIANLHGRLAFNSSWHLFSSIFNWNFVSSQPLNQVNGFFCLWMLLYFLAERKLHPENNRIRTFTGLAAVFLFFPLIIIYHLIDPSADYVVIFWTLLILYEVFSYHEKRNPAIISFLCISSVYLLTVKLTSFILLSSFLLYLRERKNQPVNTITLALICMVIVLPYLATNYIMSGYIIYPYLDVSSLNPIWKVDGLTAQHEITGVKYSPFVRWVQADMNTLAAMKPLLRYKLFFAGIRLPEKMIFASAFLASLINLAIYLFPRKYDIFKKYTVAVAFAGFIMVMLSAPDVRFAAGYIFFSYIILLLLLFSKVRLPQVAIVILCAGSAIAATGLYHHLKKVVATTASATAPSPQNGISFNPLLPEPYPLRAPGDSINIQGHSFFLFDESKREFHWNTIPAMYTPAKNITLIDSTDIRGGFKMKG